VRRSKRIVGSLTRPEGLGPPCRWFISAIGSSDPAAGPLAPGSRCSPGSPLPPGPPSTPSTARPEMLSHKVSLLLSIHLCPMDRTLPLDESHPLRHRVFRRDRDHHGHMIGQQMPFFDPTLFLLRQLAEYLAHTAAVLHTAACAGPWGINTTWYLHSHLVWLRLSIASIANSLSWALAATSGSLCDGLRYLSNFYCLPAEPGVSCSY
jgi:hypothetical protein